MSARMAIRLAFALAVLAGVWLAFGGVGMKPVLLVPVASAAIPLLAEGSPAARALRMAAAALLAGWVLLSIASVGMLYLPSALLLALSAVERKEPSPRS